MKMNKHVAAAVKRAAKHLSPTAEELAAHAEQDRKPTEAVLLNVSRVLAADAAEVLAPLAGQPIDDATRDKLARAFAVALYDNLPPLKNLTVA